MRTELADEFDKNFDRKAFFTKKWKRRANPNAKGSLLMVTGTMRRSVKAEIKVNGVRFSSAVPYAAISAVILMQKCRVKCDIIGKRRPQKIDCHDTGSVITPPGGSAHPTEAPLPSGQPYSRA